MGGMGEVFLAEDTQLERQVAIKCLAPKAVGNEQAEKRLIREAKAAANLDHPNICAVHEVGKDGDRAFIVMQFIEGDTLSSRLRDAPPSVEESVEIVAQIAEALVEAHSHGVVHRDIKPQNLMITTRGQVKVLDFGLSKWSPVEIGTDTQQDTRSMLTEHGMMIGTVAYMSPEQARGEGVDARTDLFALGAVLYECLVGRPAFSGNNSMDVCAQVIHVNPDRPSDLNRGVPFELDRIVSKAMSKDRAKRYQSASELLADLRAAQTHLQTRDKFSLSMSAERIATSARKFSRSLTTERGGRTKAIAAIALIVAAVAVWLIARNVNAGPHQPSPDARRFYDLGTTALRDGAYYQASKMLESAIERDGKYVLARARLAEAYVELDFTVKAKDELLKAQSLIPDRASLPRVEATYIEAITAVVTRDFKTAIAAFQKMAGEADKIDKPTSLLALGRSYEKDENPEKAIATYLEVIASDALSPAALLRLAVIYGRQQKLEEANDYFEKAEKAYHQLLNAEGQCEVLFQRGILLSTRGKLPEAHAKLDAALRMARDAENTYQTVRTLLRLSSLAFNEGNTVVAKQNATEGIQLAQTNEIRSLATNGLIDLGYALMSRGEFDESREALKNALDSAEADKSPLGKARALLGQGNLNLQQDNPDEAIRCLSQARDFYQAAGYPRQTSTCLLLLSRANRGKGEYDAALKTSEDVLSLAMELSDNSLAASAHSNIGNVLGIYQERYAEGLAHMEESQRLYKFVGDTFGVGYQLMNQGLLLWQLGRYDQARTVLDQAFNIANHPDASYKPLLGFIYLANAQMLLSEMRFSESITKSQKAIELAANQDKDVSIQGKCTLGLAMALSGASRAGKQMCEEAVDAARKTPNQRLLSSSLLALAEAMLTTNEAKDALTNALEAQISFERNGQHDSLWQAWVVAARASKVLANGSAIEHATRAMDSLSAFQQTLGAQASAIYLNRRDVQARRKQIEQIGTSTK